MRGRCALVAGARESRPHRGCASVASASTLVTSIPLVMFHVGDLPEPPFGAVGGVVAPNYERVSR